jgi:hypothetical protein
VRIAEIQAHISTPLHCRMRISDRLARPVIAYSDRALGDSVGIKHLRVCQGVEIIEDWRIMKKRSTDLVGDRSKLLLESQGVRVAPTSICTCTVVKASVGVQS